MIVGIFSGDGRLLCEVTLVQRASGPHRRDFSGSGKIIASGTAATFKLYEDDGTILIHGCVGRFAGLSVMREGQAHPRQIYFDDPNLTLGSTVTIASLALFSGEAGGP